MPYKCKEREKEYHKEYNKKYYPQHRSKTLQAGYRNRERIRLEALSRYSIRGVIRCARCGNANIDVLVIDHIEDGGNAHRRAVGKRCLNYWLRDNNYPEGFQVLCSNCNLQKEVKRRREQRSGYNSGN